MQVVLDIGKQSVAVGVDKIKQLKPVPFRAWWILLAWCEGEKDQDIYIIRPLA